MTDQFPSPATPYVVPPEPAASAAGPGAPETTRAHTTDAAPERPSRVVVVPPTVPMLALLGPHDQLLTTMERNLPSVEIFVRGNEIHMAGPELELDLAERLLDELLVIAATGQQLNRDAVERSIRMLRDHVRERPADVLTMNIVSNRGRTIRPKTVGQKRYVDAIDAHTIVFGIGPAGTGKTYLAMAKAVAALQAKAVNRIILTRPAVEAGERLGFLPGSLNDKIDPYLRPLYDALHDMVDPESIPRLMAAGTIEVAPLAYMRGRSLNDAFIILDEAQNTSPEQMKMFLTRLGFGSKMVVTGDITQVDLPGGILSGLRVVRDILAEVDDIHFAELTAQDVVRHRLVGDIVEAYGRWDETQRPEHPAPPGPGGKEPP
jgi:phosphate starvation-inducible PhoH-like protein